MTLRLQEQLFRCQAVADLRKSLQAERDAVFDFLFTAVDDVSPQRLAFCLCNHCRAELFDACTDAA